MNPPSSFRFQLQDKVALITLARPDKLNSLTFEVYRELRDLFFDLEREPAASAVVITGEGRGFCSGGDVNAIIGELFSQDMVGVTDFARMTCDLIR
ncbi:MAG TPA: enoyl-CoA hydratase/isomerase family protein, partial [Myxococcaceae bacterium]|nr:enoyl-CoA hydratase/isomerase family protein [Myxococcaceae bacterium]